ncbi:MAG: GNAT family N-acetyltransferase [Syntrophobacteraceae bacterium]|jgi:ribosomal protein S18 acetylase RimI-like enzyme
MEIERAMIEDAPRILALQKLAYRSEAEIYNDFSIQPLLQTLEDLKGEFQSHNVFKVMQGNDLVGSVRTLVKGDTCYAGKLIVHPAHQNQGIGHALLAYIESHNNMVKRFELFTGHRSARNLYLYEKLGYREYKREKADDRLILIFLEKQREAT